MRVFCVYILWLCVGTESMGISDFWSDDYKVFEKVYGRTSDKDLYGDKFPISYTNLDKFKNADATEKKERLIGPHGITEFDPYSFKEKYAKMFAQQILEQDAVTSPPAKSYNFISFNSKPISLQSDPETYNYLKNLDHHDSLDKNRKIPQRFQNPYHAPEDAQIYKSIQDILNAHERNKDGTEEDDEESEQKVKYVDYESGRSRKPHTRRPVEDSKPRCRVTRCRKRAGTVTVGPSSYISRITQNRWISG
ncbi:hypothetical protein ACJJTC_007235 [Scirpophaga incertulas]